MPPEQPSLHVGHSVSGLVNPPSVTGLLPHIHVWRIVQAFDGGWVMTCSCGSVKGTS